MVYSPARTIYSARRTSAGSTEAARRAGRKAAISDTIASSALTPLSVSGSLAPTPKSRLRSSRAALKEPTSPMSSKARPAVAFPARYFLDTRVPMNRLNAQLQISFTPPMECTAVSSIPEGPSWVYELKLDGFRGQAIRDHRGIRLYSRNGKDFTRKYPHVAAALSPEAKRPL
jgi:ATP-dependent DNA ligase